jgi:glucokinase
VTARARAAMRVPPGDSAVLAFDVGGTTIKAEVIEGGNTLVADQRPTPHGAAAVDAIAEFGSELIAAAPPIGSAGVLLPGLVDARRGVGVFSANIGWRDVPVAGPLAKRWGTPVHVDHDVIVAGWAEWQAGAGRGVDDLVYVSLGTGISAAIVSAGRIIRGGDGGGRVTGRGGGGQAGELGHILVRSDGPTCGCGARGCLESVASAAAIRRDYETRSGETVAGAEAVVQRAGDDPTARAVLADAIAALADGVAALVQILAPSRIVIGGGLVEAGDALLDPLRAALADRCRVVSAPEVVAARFGRRAGVVGAALLAELGPIAEAVAP